MRRLVALITCLCVLAHSIFGCCGHHTAVLGKGDATPCCQAVVCAAPEGHERHADDIHRHHDHQAGWSTDRVSTAGAPGEHDRSPVPGHECRHEHCQWLTTKDDAKSIVPDVNFELPLLFIARLSDVLPPQARLVVPADGRESFAPPLRAHLLYGVLLI